ncbi:luciferin 4-monooxygenase-like [Spodoptera frugiperda]|uniref:Luciferin 4-monooxygenase-like n=1 Tax=Spodoptera frugiperda TaxID=7108 RepID=A0A9R0DCG1_SPOFR|nr:luciferin 4-monooxygenase-like [Spodoptera frugiperda]
MEQFMCKNEVMAPYLDKLGDRVVANSGIPSDRYHLGKLIFQSIKDDPDLVMQIDGRTGESETNASVLKRTIRCATAFRNLGVNTGDVIVLMGANHLDLAVPLYAALYQGIATATIDRTLLVGELEATFNNLKPKIVFCQSEKVSDVQKAIAQANLNSKVISFDPTPDAMSFSKMMGTYGEEIDVNDFKLADFDPQETIAYLVSTSGTTGLPKSAIITHMNMSIGGGYIFPQAKQFPPVRSVLIVAPLQWLSALVNFVMGPIFQYGRIQSSVPVLTTPHILELIKKYEPRFMISSPPMMTALMKANCDFSCYDVLYLGGSAVPREMIEELRRLNPKTYIVDVYGMSEVGSMALANNACPLGSSGKPMAHIKYKLVDVDTGAEVTEPHKRGELWIQIPGYFKGYYNNPEATAEVLTEDKWFKTGDMMYRDEEWNFFFVERIKLLLKYKNHQISPVELEAVIRQHPGVLDVAVTSLTDPDDGDLPVACVVQRPGFQVTADEIKNLVKEKLTDTKHLRGGVMFLNELPLTQSTKVHRRKLKELVAAKKDELL